MVPIDEQVEHLREHIPIARLGRDIEGVHQLRVATRRLDVWLRLAERRILRPDLAWLRRSAAMVRDLDVVLETELPGPLRGWLVERHAAARAALVSHLDDERAEGLLAALSVLPPISEEAARRGVGKIAKRAWKAGRQVDETPEDVDRIHRLRRALRRLRYGLEWAGAKAAAKPFKQLQDSLGRVGDLSVSLGLADQSPAAPELNAFRTNLAAQLSAASARAVNDWREASPTVKELRRGWTSS